MKIYKYGEDILNKKTAKVNFNLVEKKLPKIIEDMTQTCIAMQGVGLAAPQVGLDMALAVILLPVDAKNGKGYRRYVLINPEITLANGNTLSEEGCLSFPGLEIEIERAEEVKVKYLNEKGLPVELKASGFFAIVLQHEIDHLNGKVFIDRLTLKQKEEAEQKLAELAKNW
ncbi:MAG: peptide deformylase [Elusimicrobiota bacterium]|nr:peptide deformylase [Elusimicrobiota bacterium]